MLNFTATMSTWLLLALLCFLAISASRGSPDTVPKDDDDLTFPFFLQCNRWEPDEIEMAIILHYHVEMVNNWEDIVKDQMHTLEKCGLGTVSSQLVVTYSHGEETDLRKIIADYPSIKNPRFHPMKKRPEQGITTQLTLDECKAREDKAIIFHFHSLGSSEYHWDWWRHKSQDDEGPYSRALYWRKYNEYFTIQNPSFCIEKLSDGALTCGVNMEHSGGHWRHIDDFWASTCKYEKTLPIIEENSEQQVRSSSGGVCAAKTLENGTVMNASRRKHPELHKSRKDRGKQIIYPEEYDESAWRFPLKCPQVDLPEGNYKIVLTYHVGMIKNWKEIVQDQLQTISKCGLGRRLDKFILSYANGEPGELLEMIKSYGDAIRADPELVPVIGSPWECPANNATLAHCKARSPDDTAKTIVFYLHNKGVSRYGEHWRKTMDMNKSYAKTGVYWRKFLEYFHIERPSLCIEKILGGASTCGAGMRGRHYSGNFWIASCDYLAQLDPCGAVTTGYIESEHWLGRKMGGGDLDPNKYVQLFKPPKVSGGSNAQLMYLYRHLIQPEEYADKTYGEWMAKGSPPSAWEADVDYKREVVKGKLNNLKKEITVTLNIE